MDSLITTRGSTTPGINYTYLATVTSATFQQYTVDNIDQYTALAFYVMFPTNKIIVQSYTIPIELFKTTTSTGYAQPTYYNGTFYLGKVYYSSSNLIYAMISNADSMQIYGIK